MPRMARHTQTLAILLPKECPVLSHANANINMSMYSYLSTVLVVAASSVNLVNSQPCWTRRRVCVQLCAVLVLVCFSIPVLVLAPSSIAFYKLLSHGFLQYICKSSSSVPNSTRYFLVLCSSVLLSCKSSVPNSTRCFLALCSSVLLRVGIFFAERRFPIVTIINRSVKRDDLYVQGT